MADYPAFASTPIIGIGQVSVANTNRDGTGTIVDIGSAAGGSGEKVTAVEVKSTGQPADSVLTLFLHDGTNYRLFREIDLGAPAAGSTTVAAYFTRITFDDLCLPSGWKLCAAVTVAPTSGVLNVIKYAGSLA